MFALYELIDLLPSDFMPTFSPRLTKLCTFLLSQNQMSEDEATVAYLGDSKRKKYFNKLKNELKKELTRYLIANPSWIDNQYKALFEDCYRNFATYKIMLLSNKRKAAIELAKTIFPNIKKIELYSLLHIVANDLMYHYSSIDVSLEVAKKYERLAQQALGVVQAEAVVRQYHSRVCRICNTRESFTPSAIAEFKEAAEQTVPFLELGVHYIIRLIYTIVVARYTATYEYQNIIKYCNEALASFPQDHPNSRSLRFVFLYNKVPALTALGQLREAKEVAKQAAQLVPKGNFNWHLAILKRIVVCLHEGAYQEAYELYKASIKHSCESPTLIEYWSIVRGYLYFLIKQERIEPYSEERFYLGKFLNEVPLYSKDKAGNNINILLLQIIIRMQREQYGHIIDRVDSLREYAKKYTKNPETKRANIFINMILKMEGAQFHRLRTETKTESLVQKLKSTPLQVGQNLAIELLPYSVLWKEILSMLENKFRAVTVKRTSRIKPRKK